MTISRLMLMCLVLLLLLPPAAVAHAEDNAESVEAAAPDPHASAREQMVQRTIIDAERLGRVPVENEAVLAAMRKVPRHRFVSGAQVAQAHADRPLPIGHGQTISQPYIVARMSELLEPREDHKILEIGAGSGYHAAVLAEVAAEVYTIEIVEELAESAAERLAELGYDNVHVKQGDGYYGWEEHAPFDGIVVTAAASHIPPPLVEQLKPGGRMIIPVGPPLQIQQLMLVEKREDGSVVQRSIIPVQFVPFTRAAPGE